MPADTHVSAQSIKLFLHVQQELPSYVFNTVEELSVGTWYEPSQNESPPAAADMEAAFQLAEKSSVVSLGFG